MLGVGIQPEEQLQQQQQYNSPATKRSGEWLLLQDIPSDVTVKVGEATFNLHKYPLISKSGYMKEKLAFSLSKDPKIITCVEIDALPGGAEAFALLSDFCYGQNVELTIENIAMLRCAAEYLEMTEEHSVRNLVSLTEDYLAEVALTSLASTLTVLRSSEELQPLSGKVRLISRCIEAIAHIICTDSTSYQAGMMGSSSVVECWWADELTALRIDTFQSLIAAMKARGFKGMALGAMIMLYAQKSLRGLDLYRGGGTKLSPGQEYEKRVVVETVVGLLPKERNAISVSFLSMLLRAALHLDTTVACRLDLERRMGVQLAQAALDDLLIPATSSPAAGNGYVSFEVDTVQRILQHYLELEAESSRLDYSSMDDEFATSPPRDVGQVGLLMEGYLAEIGSDERLTVEKFVGLAELIPERARLNDDGMYRAVDIYLKAHPSLDEAARKRVCGVLDCRKLSREACAHAAQNTRLPATTVVQVLYYEQHRIRGTPSTSLAGGESPVLLLQTAMGTPRSGSAEHEFSRLQRENNELRLELLRMKMRMKDSPSSGAVPLAASKPPLPLPPPKKSILSSMSKKLSRLNPFANMDAGKARPKPPKDRRHSIS